MDSHPLKHFIFWSIYSYQNFFYKINKHKYQNCLYFLIVHVIFAYSYPLKWGYAPPLHGVTSCSCSVATSKQAQKAKHMLCTYQRCKNTSKYLSIKLISIGCVWAYEVQMEWSGPLSCWLSDATLSILFQNKNKN
jgi:hypothetical protein